MKAKKITVNELNDVVTIEEEFIKKGLPHFLKRCEAEHVQKTLDSNKGSIFTFGKSYFYRCGGTPEKLRDRVAKQLKEAGFHAEAITWGDNYASFRGGCKPMSARDSFFWATFLVKRTGDVEAEKPAEEKPAEDWQPKRGETVYAFQASYKRVVSAPVRSITGDTVIILDTPANERSSYSFHWVGRTPKEAMNKALTQIISERDHLNGLINFLVVHKDGPTDAE